MLPANAVDDDVPKASTVLAVFAVMALAWPDVIVVVLPANAVEDVAPNASTVLAVFAVIALA